MFKDEGKKRIHHREAEEHRGKAGKGRMMNQELRSEDRVALVFNDVWRFLMVGGDGVVKYIVSLDFESGIFAARFGALWANEEGMPDWVIGWARVGRL